MNDGVKDNGNERRTEQRKATALPVAIGHENQPDLPVSHDPERSQTRKKPGYEMKVAVFFQAIEDALILNLTKQGIAIVAKTFFAPGKKLNVSFLVPDELTSEQIPIFAKCLVMWSREAENRGFITGLKILLMDSEDAQFLASFVDTLPEATN